MNTNKYLQAHLKTKLFILLLLSVVLFIYFQPFGGPQQASVTSTRSIFYFSENFSGEFTLNEVGDPELSSSPDWWLNSGASLIYADGVGSTVLGQMSGYSSWRNVYNQNNPLDTDNGQHPQNIFRLVTRKIWGDAIQQAYFRINEVNLSASSNRNASNGIFLFSKYMNGDNLYYFGLRVDGNAVIKKKIGGIYYTLAQKQIFNGKWDLKNNPNLIPVDTWVGLRSVTYQLDDNMYLKFYINFDKDTNNWIEALTGVDNPSIGGRVFKEKGRGGLRTDFMDVFFDDYLINENIDDLTKYKQDNNALI